jgi:hypothetical protein
MHDSDCTQGTNGRCLPPTGNGAGYQCTYDACSTDADCGAGKLCLCGTTLGITGSDGTPMRSGNKCLPADCRVDSDCGPGGYCSPSYDTSCGPYSGYAGYHCHTTKDSCTTDESCGGSGNGGVPYCAWAPETASWTCSRTMCAG